ncbi:MAG: hypothetical protein ACOH2A_02445 [Sphingobacteriaceae bacterium]
MPIPKIIKYMIGRMKLTGKKRGADGKVATNNTNEKKNMSENIYSNNFLLPDLSAT